MLRGEEQGRWGRREIGRATAAVWLLSPVVWSSFLKSVSLPSPVVWSSFVEHIS